MAAGGMTQGGQHPAPGAASPPPPMPPTRVPTGPRPGPEERHARRTQLTVAAISAIATVLAAVIAGVLAINAGSVHVSLTDPAAEVDDLRATATSLERVNATLSERNDELESELDAVPTAVDRRGGGTTVTTSGPESDTSSVRRQTEGVPLTFTWGYSVDLDSIDNDWAVDHGSTSVSDLYLDGYGRLNTYEVVIFDHVPTESECRDATVRQTRLENEQSAVGTMMCVSTSEDRYAFVRIAAFDEEQRTTSVDIVVWE